jgi:hypothetical protein
VVVAPAVMPGGVDAEFLDFDLAAPVVVSALTPPLGDIPIELSEVAPFMPGVAWVAPLMVGSGRPVLVGDIGVELGAVIGAPGLDGPAAPAVWAPAVWAAAMPSGDNARLATAAPTTKVLGLMV